MEDNRYFQFKIPKRKGGYRTILAPNSELKNIQLDLLHNLIYKYFNVSKFCHGFVPGRSIVTNAIPHVGKKYVLKMDIKDFFPSILWDNFENKLYIFAMKHPDIYITQNLNIIKKQLQRNCFYNRKFLPQGAPTSPYLANIYLLGFDTTIGKVIFRTSLKNVNIKLDYTRYADDLTFSCNSVKFLYFMKNIVITTLKYYQLKIHSEKTKIISSNNRQVVTGLVVNEKINLPKETRKRIRAIKHHIDTNRKTATLQDLGHMAFEYMVKKQKNNYVYTNTDAVQDYTIAQMLSQN